MLKYIILGAIQGVTEFLPVSSSAHLIFAQKLLDIRGQELALSVILHLGTILALVIFFFKDILALLKDRKSLLLVALVTLITGIIGLSGRNFFEALFSSAKVAALALIITGSILLLTKRIKGKQRNEVDSADALILGLVQGLAIIPGISRSGITVSTLLFRKITWEESFKFSFLASIPAVLGAALLEAHEIKTALSVYPANLVMGFITSLSVGLVSLWLLKACLRRARLHYFGCYCILLALVIIFLL